MTTNLVYLYLAATNSATNAIGGRGWLDSNAGLAKDWGPVVIGLVAILATFGAQLLLLRRQRQQFQEQTRNAQAQFAEQTRTTKEHFERQAAAATQQFDRQITNGQEQFRQQMTLSTNQLNLSKSKDERDEIMKKLNTFYGPFKECRTESRLLYEKFAVDLQIQERNQDRHFRTLRVLLQGQQLTEPDKNLFEQILAINHKVLDLIESGSGVVDKPELQDLLGKLGAHIRILQLAYDKRLSGAAANFESIVFPLAIDGAIESATLRLQQRLSELSGLDLEKSPQSVSKGIDVDTIRFYDKQSDAYQKQTAHLDISPLYKAFRRYLSSASLLSAEDFRDPVAKEPAELVRRLQAGAASYFWKRFSASSQSSLLSPDLTREQFESVALPELNKILLDVPICDDPAFKGPMPPDVLALRSQNPQGEGTIRLNRLLLCTVFSAEIKGIKLSKENRFGGRLLDAGCGVGRDTRYFIEHGYSVVSFDASEEMVRKSSEYPHAFCQRLSFSGLTYKEEFDGVWACASLLHLTRSDAKDAVRRLTIALKPGGVMFVSVKEGKGALRDKDGRYFELYDDETIGDLFKSESDLVLHEKWTTPSVSQVESADANWLNLILKRRDRR